MSAEGCHVGQILLASPTPRRLAQLTLAQSVLTLAQMVLVLDQMMLAQNSLAQMVLARKLPALPASQMENLALVEQHLALEHLLAATTSTGQCSPASACSWPKVQPEELWTQGVAAPLLLPPPHLAQAPVEQWMLAVVGPIADLAWEVVVLHRSWPSAWPLEWAVAQHQLHPPLAQKKFGPLQQFAPLQDFGPAERSDRPAAARCSAQYLAQDAPE